MSKDKKLKDIPKFKNEDEEREFWAKADATEYFDMDKPVKLDLSKLKPTTESISLRLPESMLDEIRRIANKHDVPYQSLIKIFLKERIDQELKSSA